MSRRPTLVAPLRPSGPRWHAARAPVPSGTGSEAGKRSPSSFFFFFFSSSSRSRDAILVGCAASSRMGGARRRGEGWEAPPPHSSTALAPLDVPSRDIFVIDLTPRFSLQSPTAGGQQKEKREKKKREKKKRPNRCRWRWWGCGPATPPPRPATVDPQVDWQRGPRGAAARPASAPSPPPPLPPNRHICPPPRSRPAPRPRPPCRWQMPAPSPSPPHPSPPVTLSLPALLSRSRLVASLRLDGKRPAPPPGTSPTRAGRGGRPASPSAARCGGAAGQCRRFLPLPRTPRRLRPLAMPRRR